MSWWNSLELWRMSITLTFFLWDSAPVSWEVRLLCSGSWTWISFCQFKKNRLWIDGPPKITTLLWPEGLTWSTPRIYRTYGKRFWNRTTNLYLRVKICNLTMGKTPEHYIKGVKKRDLNLSNLLSPSSLLRVVNFRCYGKVVNRVQIFIVLFVAATFNMRRFASSIRKEILKS